MSPSHLVTSECVRVFTFIQAVSGGSYLSLWSARGLVQNRGTHTRHKTPQTRSRLVGEWGEPTGVQQGSATRCGHAGKVTGNFSCRTLTQLMRVLPGSPPLENNLEGAGEEGALGDR